MSTTICTLWTVWNKTYCNIWYLFLMNSIIRRLRFWYLLCIISSPWHNLFNFLLLIFMFLRFILFYEILKHINFVFVKNSSFFIFKLIVLYLCGTLFKFLIWVLLFNDFLDKVRASGTWSCSRTWMITCVARWRIYWTTKIR